MNDIGPNYHKSRREIRLESIIDLLEGEAKAAAIVSEAQEKRIRDLELEVKSLQDDNRALLRGAIQPKVQP